MAQYSSDTADILKLDKSSTILMRLADLSAEHRVTKIIVPQSVVTIQDRAFFNCRKLKEVQFPDRLKTIGKYAFCYTSLDEIQLPDSVESIGDDAFFACPVKKIRLSRNLRSVGQACCPIPAEITMYKTCVTPYDVVDNFFDFTGSVYIDKGCWFTVLNNDDSVDWQIYFPNGTTNWNVHRLMDECQTCTLHASLVESIINDVCYYIRGPVPWEVVKQRLNFLIWALTHWDEIGVPGEDKEVRTLGRRMVAQALSRIMGNEDPTYVIELIKAGLAGEKTMRKIEEFYIKEPDGFEVIQYVLNTHRSPSRHSLAL